MLTRPLRGPPFVRHAATRPKRTGKASRGRARPSWDIDSCPPGA